ncbi:MAG: hypothetical protein Q8P59_12410 [Dehalococcoidia bacterium]|nr:hypothetical protein [Dehalococcoidia bacterium]
MFHLLVRGGKWHTVTIGMRAITKLFAKQLPMEMHPWQGPTIAEHLDYALSVIQVATPLG